MPIIIREHIEDLSMSQASSLHESELVKMQRFYDRVDDKEQVEEAITKAWGMGVTKKTVGDAGETIETYVQEAFADKVHRGEIDAINTGFAHKICDSKGTLFTEPGGSMTLTHESVEDLEKPSKLLERHRKEGGYKATLTASDRASVFMGSVGVMVAYQRRSLRYHKIMPGDIRAFFGSSVVEYEEGDTEEAIKPRPVDRSRIHDASVVLVRLGKIDASDYAWIAIVPRNTEYEFGRYVAFSAPNVVTRLPDPGDEGAIDYEVDGTRCNPLTWLAVHSPELDIPEIPISIIRGGHTDSKDLFPVSRSIYRLALSFDKNQSHIVGKSGEKASGTTKLTTTVEAEGKPLPRTLTGAVHLLPGQDIDDMAHDASACETAHNILKDVKEESAGSFAVPQFMISDDEGAIAAAESGISRAIKAQPLNRNRDYREEINQPFVRELFHIEQAYLAFKQEDDPGVVDLLLECDQVWDSGLLQLPQNTKELVEELSKAMDDGYMDIIEAIRRYYQCPNDEAAKATYKRMAERREEFPPLNFKEKQAEQQAKLESRKMSPGTQRGGDDEKRERSEKKLPGNGEEES